MLGSFSLNWFPAIYMNSHPIVLFVLPSLRVSGGVIETIRLAQELIARGVDVRVLSLWKHPQPLQQSDIPGISDVPIVYLSQLKPQKSRAVFDLLFMVSRYRSYLRMLTGDLDNNNLSVVFTHYSTLVFLWFTPASQQYCFLQGEEWLFAAKSILRGVFRWFVLFAYAHCRIITANAYLSEQLRSLGLTPVAEAPVWADAYFGNSPLNESRSVDLVMVLRQGYVKRLDLYLLLIGAVKKSAGTSCAVITPDDEIAAKVVNLVDVCLLRPNREEMRALYQRSKVFVLLSEREGFGLPPLEAMGSGCVPICRDSGGVRCYMTGGLAQYLVPLDAPLRVIERNLYALLADQDKRLELSEEARQVFMDGARESKWKRERALTVLSSI